MMMPPAIRRVPAQDETSEHLADEGRIIATFIIDDELGGYVRYNVFLPWRDGDLSLNALEEEAREALRKRLRDVLASI